MVITGVILVVLTCLAVAFGRPRRSASPVWDEFLSGDLETAERALGPLAKRFSRGPLVGNITDTIDQHGRIVRDIHTGGAFMGNVEVYLGVQIAALFVGAALVAMSFLEGLGTGRWIFALLGPIIGYWPYNKVRDKAQKREAEVIEHLPDFADLLLMVLPTMSVPQALAFTAARSEGPIALEMREMARTLAAQGMNDIEAFDLFARRLGTPEGREFLTSLKASYLEGATAVDNIRAQAENLRAIKYQMQRAIAKKLPVTLVVRFTIHFMPLLFVLAFLPVLYSLTSVGS